MLVILGENLNEVNKKEVMFLDKSFVEFLKIKNMTPEIISSFCSLN